MRPLLAVLLVLGLPAAARAQGPCFDVALGFNDMTGAGSSAKAVFGSSGGLVFGAGAGYAFDNGITLGLMARVFSKDGQRVFVADRSGPVFGLGHPLSVRLVPVHLTLGYRLRGERRLQPYLAIGAGFASYRETSTVGGLEQSDSATKASGIGLIGAELGRGKVRLGLEAAYTLVPDALGLGGVSKVYGETGAGGASVVAKVVIGGAPRRR